MLENREELLADVEFHLHRMRERRESGEFIVWPDTDDPSISVASYHLRKAQEKRIIRSIGDTIKWPEIREQNRFRVEQRKYPITDKVKLLLGGGTIFSDTDDYGTRTGTMRDKDASDYISECFPQYKPFIDEDEIEIYNGLSEDLYTERLEEMAQNVTNAINSTPDISKFIMFVGSDMTEVVGQYLENRLGMELTEKNIQLYLVWANNPVPKKDALKQIKSALHAARSQKRNGGIYIVSDEVIKAENARKKTWHGKPMGYFNIKNKKETHLDELRRDYYAQIADSVVRSQYKQSLELTIEEMDPDRFKNPLNAIMALERSHAKSLISSYTRMGSSESQKSWLLWHLATDPIDHPKDETNEVVIKHVNLPTPKPTQADLQKLYDELKSTKAVIFVLNHSATTSVGLADMIAEVCNRRIYEGDPLAAFAVTENGEPRNFHSDSGIYTSAMLLRNHVILLPGHLMPNFIKLYGAIHKNKMKVNPQLIDFMTKNLDPYISEIDESLLIKSDIDRVKETLFERKNLSLPAYFTDRKFP